MNKKQPIQIKIPGKDCPDCGQRYQQPVSPNFDYWVYEEVPHQDPRDCIRYLREQLDNHSHDIGRC